MELLVQQIPKIEPIKFNYEELKTALQERVHEYKTVVYTAENIREARSDRAKLNALKKSLNDERIRLEREFMEPFQDFKAKVTDLVMIVDEASKVIDKQVKDYEEIQKEEKKAKITEAFQATFTESYPWLEVSNIFDTKWLNASVSMKKIQEDMDAWKIRIETDLGALSRLPEYSFEAIETYKKSLRLEDGYWQADHLKQMAEAKKQAEEAATLHRDNADEPEQMRVEEFMPESAEPNMAISEPQRVTLRFEIEVTMDEAMKLKHFFKTQGIAFRQIV